MEKLWTTSEVAKFLDVAEVDVEQLVRQGKLTGYKLGGQFLRFRPEQVEALKGTLQFRPAGAKPTGNRQGSWFDRLRDFLYFYDFYVVSATLLAAMVVYLIVSG
ncbi:MAG: helix-turn-helix domain-containing protein [Candidatus Omnitrophica bacterium]|nr:helix-turn-helix domain-containing protein [Candidatus Omnitrophota bacterium]MBI2495578.1 helix-turn-helix domain-containing protein [Candidatus Omnitrophota bacterium]MBI3083241.1 helix-turn-helix domain-containing protein [Candidatus Omnitrophota bacterium]